MFEPMNGNVEDARILGRLGSADGRGVVRVEDRVDADPANLWSALTNPQRLAQWLGDVTGDLRLNGAFRARFHASGWEGTGRVEVCEPRSRLRVRTKDDEHSDGATLEVTLTADGDQTVVVWEERGMPVELVAAYGAGIQIHVEDLVDHVGGGQRRDPEPRFDALYPSYQALAAGLF